MTVLELIEKLQELQGDESVVYEVNGDETRTGDFFVADGIEVLTLRPTTYGGNNRDDGTHDPRFNADHTFKGILIK